MHDEQLTPNERLVRLTAEKLARLPEVPFRVELRDDVLLVTEKPPAVFVPKRLRALHEPAVISTERESDLNDLAQLVGYKSIIDLAHAPIDLVDITEHVSPYLRRYVSEHSTALEALREMRRAALEAEYVTRALTLARQVVQEKLPELCPNESTVGLINNDATTVGGYSGRFGGHHLMEFQAQNITRHDIDTLTVDSEIVGIAAHELLHQKHSEVQGVSLVTVGIPDTAPFNEVVTEDPWEIKQLVNQYWSEVESPSEDAKLKHQLCSHLTETIAYLGESELRGYLIDTRGAIQDNTTINSPQQRQTEYHWITTFANMAPQGARTQLIQRLMRVNFREFGDMTRDEVIDIINNPTKVLQFETTLLAA